MNSGKRQRFQPVDIMRGIAIVLMVVYHFCYDLTWFGIAGFDFYEDRFWRGSRTFILGMFLLLVGVSLVLATRRRINWPSYLKRLFVLVLCAALISVATRLVFGERMIFFGVLHFIAVASVVGLLFIRLFWMNAVLGAAAIMLGVYYSNPFFDRPLLQWFGLMTFRPETEDYVPFLPWFGTVLFGLFLGKLLLARPALSSALNWQGEQYPARLLALSGRHSLLIYMLHQPVLLGILWLATR